MSIPYMLVPAWNPNRRVIMDYFNLDFSQTQTTVREPTDDDRDGISWRGQQQNSRCHHVIQDEQSQ